ncbi:MAG: hypothetical protein HFG80_14285 [Eubacterium sp.]|nr:hypothetical protein [Eubacterium sp.]
MKGKGMAVSFTCFFVNSHHKEKTVWLGSRRFRCFLFGLEIISGSASHYYALTTTSFEEAGKLMWQKHFLCLDFIDE